MPRVWSGPLLKLEVEGPDGKIEDRDLEEIGHGFNLEHIARAVGTNSTSARGTPLVDCLSCR